MAYYILRDGFELCGWKGLPFALRYPNPYYADFFDREDYRLVYRMNGRQDIDVDSLTDSQKKLLDRLLERDICLTKMGDCICHNEKCRDCKYRLACGAGCRAAACGETGTDYLGIDEDTCRFFKGGWYEKARSLIERYKDSFPSVPNGEPESGEKTLCGAAALEELTYKYTRRSEIY